MAAAGWLAARIRRLTLRGRRQRAEQQVEVVLRDGRAGLIADGLAQLQRLGQEGLPGLAVAHEHRMRADLVQRPAFGSPLAQGLRRHQDPVQHLQPGAPAQSQCQGGLDGPSQAQHLRPLLFTHRPLEQLQDHIHRRAECAVDRRSAPRPIG